MEEAVADGQQGGRCDGRRDGADGAERPCRPGVGSGSWPSSGAQQGDHGGVADERQRDEVGQQPLVEVGGQEHHERRGVDAQHERGRAGRSSGPRGRRRWPPTATTTTALRQSSRRTEPSSWAGQRAARRSAARPKRAPRMRAASAVGEMLTTGDPSLAATAGPAGLHGRKPARAGVSTHRLERTTRGVAACRRVCGRAAGGVAWPATEAVNVGRPPCPGRCVQAARWELIVDRA